MTRGVVAHGADGTVTVEDFELAPVGAGDARVRIRAAGVCHSDLSMTNATLAPHFPVVLGHEAAGEVVEVGAGVDGYRPGDRVVLNWSPGCGRCWFCGHDEPWLCTAASGEASRPGGVLGGAQLHVGLGIGAFADEVVVPSSALVALPTEVGFEVGALLGCAVLTGVGAVVNTARVRSGESVAVFGVGGVGLSVIAGAALAGAHPIVAVDLSPEKEPLARALGATEFVVASADAGKRVRHHTGGRGADHTFECVGSAATIRAAWAAARRGGQCVVVGVGRRDDPVTFTPMEIYYFNRRLASSVYGSSVPARDVPLLAAHVVAGRLDVGALITHRVGLGGVAEAFARMRAGEGGRTIVTPGDRS